MSSEYVQKIQRRGTGMVLLVFLLGWCSVLCAAAVVGANTPENRSPLMSYGTSLFEAECAHTICDGVPEGRFLNNPLNCPAFFQCVNGRAHAGECPGGTWFNYKAQICDAPWHVACDSEHSEVIQLECITEQRYVISCRGRDDLHTIQHPRNCSEFYLCIGGEAVLRQCAPGLEFNTEFQQCMLKEDANCVFSECPPFNYPLTFLRSTSSCNEFSICFYGEPVPHNCADGLHWDQEHEWCTVPEEANCDIGGGEGSGEGEIELVCHDDSPIFNPNPNDCNAYFLCGIDRIPHPQFCAEGLYFDMDTNQCTTKELAICYPGN